MSKDANPILTAALDYALRGLCIIPIKPGTKQAACKWKLFQSIRPGEANLRRWFEKSQNYPAVILGDISGGLVCRDFDVKAAYDFWAESHVELAHLLPTVQTARGRHVYFRSQWQGFRNMGDGELRGDTGHYCLLPPAVHPTGVPYEWLLPLPAEELPIIDPFDSNAGFTQSSSDVTEEDRANISNSVFFLGEETLERINEAMVKTLPTGKGQRNKAVFEFARHLRGIPGLSDLHLDAFKTFVEEWHSQALPVIGTKPLIETWIDFLKGWPRVKCPANEEFMPMILIQAQSNPVGGYDDPRLNVLAAICRELQGINGQGFYLATRTAGKLLGVSHTQISRWLFLLEHDRLIETVEKGGTTKNPRKATRFRYIGPQRRPK